MVARPTYHIMGLHLVSRLDVIAGYNLAISPSDAVLTCTAPCCFVALDALCSVSRSALCFSSPLQVQDWYVELSCLHPTALFGWLCLLQLAVKE